MCCAALTSGEREQIFKLLKTVKNGEMPVESAIDVLDLKLRPLNAYEKKILQALAEGRTLTAMEALKTLLKEEDGK